MPLSSRDSRSGPPSAPRPEAADEPTLPRVTVNLQVTAFALFAVAVAGNALVAFGGADLQHQRRWLEMVLWLLATGSTLVNLAARLSPQNVLVVAPLTALFAWVVESINVRSGVPFGARVFTEELGGPVLWKVPWLVPLVWLVMIINSRGVARLLLRPFRRATYYGFWLIGVTSLLTALFDFGLEPFAGTVRAYWRWQTAAGTPAWHGAPWAGFLGWTTAAIILLGFTTPWFITKRPVPQPLDFHPLAIWALLQLNFAAGCAAHRLWAGAIAASVLGIGVSAAALWSVRWAQAAREKEE